LDALSVSADSAGPSGAALESEHIRTILQERRSRTPTATDFGEIRFGFLAKREGSAGELADAIALSVELPEVESASEEANRRYQAELTPETEAEKERLRERRSALFARLGQMGRWYRGSMASNDKTDSGDAPSIDSNDASIKKLIARAKRRGIITYDESNEASPQDQMSSEQIEDIMAAISEMGVNIVESDEDAVDPEDNQQEDVEDVDPVEDRPDTIKRKETVE
ncbi:hypothetical protein OY671_008820, partial [Metschnikowia pulcherrima]